MDCRRTASIPFLALFLLSGPGVATLLADGTGRSGETGLQGAFLCPDLARTELFRSKGLEYVHTLAFADALSTVAGGRSSFAPPPVPREWQDASSRWLMHLLTHDAGLLPRSVLLPLGEGFSAEEEPCDAQLLHKSSLEFRARPGNGAAGVVYPYYVPLAEHELEEMILPHAVRAERLADSLAEGRRIAASQGVPCGAGN